MLSRNPAADIKDSDPPSDRGEEDLLEVFGKYILSTADGIFVSMSNDGAIWRFDTTG